jgi:hypothetical protein
MVSGPHILQPSLARFRLLSSWRVPFRRRSRGRQRRAMGIGCALTLGFATGLASRLLDLSTTATAAIWLAGVTGGVWLIVPRILRKPPLRLDVYLDPSSEFRTVKVWKGNALIMSVGSEHPFEDAATVARSVEPTLPQ